MKRPFLGKLLLCGVGMLALVGCGGGGSDASETGELTRVLLSGTGDGASLTTKKWRTIFLKVNGNYIGTGADQACPVEVESRGGGSFTSCNPENYLELRSDGKSRSKDEDGLSETFDDLWQLTGNTLSSVSNSNGGTDRVVASYALTDEGIVGGRQRLRLRTLSETEPDGTTLRPEEVGFEFVIEELP